MSHSPPEPAWDGSDRIAAERLVYPDTGLDPMELRFRNQFRPGTVLGFGSWSFMIVSSMTVMALSGEIPSTANMPAVATIYAIGLALGYVAVRSVIGRATLRVEGRTLVFQRWPWPSRSKRWSLDEIERARFDIYPESFLYPSRVRGMLVARPFRVLLTDHEGHDVALSLVLSQAHAAEVARWIQRAR